MTIKNSILRGAILSFVVLVLISTASAATNNTGTDVKEAEGVFNDMTGGLGFVGSFLIGAFLQLGVWGLALCAIFAIAGAIFKKPGMFNYGLYGIGIIILVFVLYAVGNIAMDYVISKYW